MLYETCVCVCVRIKEREKDSVNASNYTDILITMCIKKNDGDDVNLKKMYLEL